MVSINLLPRRDLEAYQRQCNCGQRMLWIERKVKTGKRGFTNFLGQGAGVFDVGDLVCVFLLTLSSIPLKLDPISKVLIKESHSSIVYSRNSKLGRIWPISKLPRVLDRNDFHGWSLEGQGPQNRQPCYITGLTRLTKVAPYTSPEWSAHPRFSPPLTGKIWKRTCD